MYYNTNKEEGIDLEISLKNSKSQEVIILSIFKDNKELSASKAWSIYNKNKNTPLTSIRRAITDLCTKGELIKTDKTVIGIYGKKEHIYKIK